MLMPFCTQFVLELSISKLLNGIVVAPQSSSLKPSVFHPVWTRVSHCQGKLFHLWRWKRIELLYNLGYLCVCVREREREGPYKQRSAPCIGVEWIDPRHARGGPRFYQGHFVYDGWVYHDTTKLEPRGARGVQTLKMQRALALSLWKAMRRG